MGSPALFPMLAAYFSEIQAEARLIPAKRKAALVPLAFFISERRRSGGIAQLVFVCTHNSRRSHLAQIWTQTAAHALGIGGIQTYSGGTEATAFDPRAVAAVERAGFRVEAGGFHDNPIVRVRYAPEAEPMECFSKVYDQAPNPRKGFCAIMTCSAADEHCPIVSGAAERIVIRYDDPKAFDGTPEETLQYDQRCRQIAGEMVWALADQG